MNNLTLPDFSVGMMVVSPASNLPHITEDRKYIVIDVEDGWIMLKDDTDDVRYYQSHLFIEADVYYNMMLWLAMMRLFDINPKEL